MPVYGADSQADPQAAWALLAQPGRWHQWAPHLRGAWGLGEPEVEVGRRGAARLLWAVPVPARITDKQEGRSWTWRVGPVDMDHRVLPRADGCRVEVEMRAPEPLESALRASYGRAIELLVRRLARAAERSA